MPRETGVRQLPSKRCGCARCLKKYPGDRPKTKNCIGNWQARWYDDAGKRQSTTRPTKTEAVHARDLARGKVAAGTWSDPRRGKVTVSEWRAEWIKIRGSVEAATLARNESHWKTHVAPRWGEKTLRSIEHKDVQIWVAELEARGLASSTVSTILNALDQLMAFAVRDKRIEANPCDGVKVKPPRKKHATASRPPTIEQILAASGRIADPIYRQLPLLVLETGLRWGEVAGLPPEAVDLEEGLLHVWQILEEVGGRKVLRPYPKSDAGFRTVPLTAAAKELVRRQYAIDDPERGVPIFRGPRGGYLSRTAYRGRIWVPATIAAGIHRKERRASGHFEHWPTIHDIRHSYASRLHDGGVSEATCKEMLGHERPQDDVTWIYTHAAPETKAIVLRALGDRPARRAAPPARRLRLAS